VVLYIYYKVELGVQVTLYLVKTLLMVDSALTISPFFADLFAVSPSEKRRNESEKP
jgi:hypothetical protein